MQVDGGNVVRIRGDRLRVLSSGFVCPQGVSLDPLHTNFDRLRGPSTGRNPLLIPPLLDIRCSLGRMKGL